VSHASLFQFFDAQVSEPYFHRRPHVQLEGEQAFQLCRVL